MTEKKKLYIKTYGCQMNVYDSGKMQDVMLPLGYEETPEYTDADMVVLNTCHIREKASEKLYSELGRIRKVKDKLKDKGRHMIIAVAGCVGQAEGEEILSRAPYVDIVVGPQSYHRLPSLVQNIRKEKGDKVDIEFPTVSKFDFLPEESAKVGISAFLTIQEGCDKFCTFCVVPYTRGAEYSRPVSEITREAMMLVERGAKEIQLLGQNVNAYHGVDHEGNAWNLGQLITHLSKVKGLERIRYTTSHPRDMHADLYRAHAEVEALQPYLHLPVQAGSNRTLKAMNRKHTREEYFMIIERLRKLRPDIAFSSDFIVGYPGETDQDFEDTMDLVRQVGFAQCYSFKYSARPGTPASLKEDQLPEDVKDARLQALQALLFQQQKDFNASIVGKTIPVLFDREGRHEGQLIGKSPYMQSVYVSADAVHQGTILNVRVDKATQNSLTGIVADTAKAA
ncbi:MAG: tRNA (N6-isopentenyl adenosine(37)-C2)-methylthiotransferase MiaB [Proteobacteria bacterium]|nr:tRNA (N6-isopentenyl adenosine(37)-C2)-methylthiotransferase MiaB [Pseudomonadota bacterium]